MATDWVMDASIAVKLVIDESDSEVARGFVDEALAGAGQFLAPHLLRYEVGQAVARRDAPPGWEKRMLTALSMIERKEPQDVAAHCGPLSYYDAAYLALAVEQRAGLLTADDKLRRAAKRLGVKVGP